MKMPIIPRSKVDPVQTNREEIAAIKEFKSRIKKVGDRFIQKVERLRVVEYPSKIRNNSYGYLLDEGEIDGLLEDLDKILATYLIADYWLYTKYVKPTYIKGSLLTKVNLGHQIGVETPFFTPKGIGASVGKIDAPSLFSPERMIERRISLVKARTFEELKGFSANMKKDLTRILSEGIANGNSVRSITDSIHGQLRVTESRAGTIARTEVSMAMKRARIDESKEAQDQFGLSVMMMQVSALSPTTRWWHAKRHGQLFTIEQVEEWLSDVANVVNCKCTFVEVFVDGAGNPISNALEARVKKMQFESEKLVKELKPI